MTEERPPYRVKPRRPDRGNGFEHLVGRRVCAMRLVRAKSAEPGVRYQMLLMLDDGTWVDVRGTGAMLPLKHQDKLDIRQLEKRGGAAYETVHLSVADPDTRRRVRVRESDK